MTDANLGQALQELSEVQARIDCIKGILADRGAEIPEAS